MNQKWFKRRSIRYLINVITFAFIAAFCFFDKQEIKSIWAGLSDTLKAGVIGGIITLIVMWRNNANALDRHELQLAHDREEKRQEREMGMRKEVYLDAAKALAKAQEHIAMIARTDKSLDEIEDLRKGLGGAINRIHVVASLPSIKALTEANEIYVKACHELIRQRTVWTAINSQLLAKQNQLKNLFEQRNNIFNQYQELVELAKKGQRNDALATHLSGIFEELSRNIDSLHNAITIDRATLDSTQVKIIKTGLEWNDKLGGALANANTFLRRELSLPFDDDDEYMGYMKDSRERIIRCTHELLDLLVLTASSNSSLPQQTHPADPASQTQ